MEFNVKRQILKEAARIKEIRNQIPFIMSMATDATARAVRTDLYKTMARVYDRPTPYVVPKNIEKPGKKGSLFLKPTNRKRGDFTAIVNVKDLALGSQRPALKFLRPTIFGTPRPLKGYEKALQARGILPKGMITRPGKDAPLDRYGNIRAGQLTQMLSFLQANRDSYQNTTDRSKGRKKNAIAYFVLKRGEEPVGIFRRRGKKLESFLIFIPQFVSYQKMFEFDRIAGTSAARHIPREVQNAIKYALANPRR
jgi:hypothetical protein